MDAASAESGVSPAAATSGATDLADGLLPASAFAPGATVLPLTEELLHSSGLPMGGLPEGGVPAGAQLDPGGCADLLAALQAAAAEGVDDAAGQAVLEGDRVTVQGLVSGAAAEGAVATVAGSLPGCERASVSVPERGAATLTVGDVREPDLGDAAVEVSATVDATLPDGRQVSVPVLAALVQDGDRVLALATAAPQGVALDEGAFADRLAEAHQVQADALG
ncbi:hypothetical protein [Geodermatophilus sp. CPCC 206100]|uniref:hypothetical protein n=1 Tax=Geodermatophilus sp. CPCC 206100 TaxID=3020054 RepID=UPI003B00FF87